MLSDILEYGWLVGSHEWIHLSCESGRHQQEISPTKRRARPELDETGKQLFDVHWICKERKAVMINDRQSRRSGSADGSVADPTRQKDETNGRRHFFYMLTRSQQPVGQRLRSEPRKS